MTGFILQNSFAIARYTLAVDRKIRKDGDATADFINCVVFGRSAEFAEKYFRKGLKITIEGRIQTRSYTNRDGQKVYTTEVVVEEQEFAESKLHTLELVSISAERKMVWLVSLLSGCTKSSIVSLQKMQRQKVTLQTSRLPPLKVKHTQWKLMARCQSVKNSYLTAKLKRKHG